MELGAETGPDNFEIQISDDMENSDNEPKSSGSVGNKVDPPGNGTVSEHDSDLLRASLSDVVFSQSVQLTDRSTDFEDADKCSGEEFVDNFDSVVVDGSVSPETSVKFPGQNAHHEEEFSDICKESSITSTEPDPSMATSTATALSLPEDPVTDSPQNENSEKELEFSADFEDAVDPPLLTSTLKTDEKDSDDEFDFDLPVSKADNGKTVRFSGGGDSEEQGKEIAVSHGDPSEVNELKLNDVPEHSDAVTAASEPSVQDSTEVKPAIPEVKVQPASPQSDDVKSDEDVEEKGDRSHIITSSAADWDNVETVEAGFGEAQTGDVELMSSAPPLQYFTDIWQHFRSMDHTAVKDKIQVTVEKHGFAAIVSRFFGPPRLHKDLHSERELVFCIAATALDNRDDQHLQSLQTIYRVLTGSRFNCQRYGSHWEEVGFQGQDPATDLRGTGMLGLVQLVHFLQHDTTAQLARDLYKLSLHPTQNFPFCLMCINISRISLQAFREGVMNRECNKQQRVMEVVNQFYAGALLHLYRIWKQGKTIGDSGFVIREVETRAKKHSKDLFKEFQMYVASQKAGAGGGGDAAFGTSGKEGDVAFFSVVKSDTKSAAELY